MEKRFLYKWYKSKHVSDNVRHENEKVLRIGKLPI